MVNCNSINAWGKSMAVALTMDVLTGQNRPISLAIFIDSILCILSTHNYIFTLFIKKINY